MDRVLLVGGAMLLVGLCVGGYFCGRQQIRSYTQNVRRYHYSLARQNLRRLCPAGGLHGLFADRE